VIPVCALDLKTYFLLSWNLNFSNKRFQSVEEVAKKVLKIGGNGKIASTTLEKTQQQLIF